MAVVNMTLFCELSLSDKFKVCCTLPGRFWVTNPWMVADHPWQLTPVLGLYCQTGLEFDNISSAFNIQFGGGACFCCCCFVTYKYKVNS